MLTHHPQATRGWEVATLRRGIAGLQPQAASELGLFCRWVGLDPFADFCRVLEVPLE